MDDYAALAWTRENVPGHPQVAPTLSVPGNCTDFDYTREWLSPTAAVREFAVRFFGGAEFEWLEEGGTADGRIGVGYGWERQMEGEPNWAPGDYVAVNIDLVETVPHGAWAIESVHAWADSLPW